MDLKCFQTITQSVVHDLLFLSSMPAVLKPTQPLKPVLRYQSDVDGNEDNPACTSDIRYYVSRLLRIRRLSQRRKSRSRHTRRRHRHRRYYSCSFVLEVGRTARIIFIAIYITQLSIDHNFAFLNRKQIWFPDLISA